CRQLVNVTLEPYHRRLAHATPPSAANRCHVVLTRRPTPVVHARRIQCQGYYGYCCDAGMATPGGESLAQSTPRCRCDSDTTSHCEYCGLCPTTVSWRLVAWFSRSPISDNIWVIRLPSRAALDRLWMLQANVSIGSAYWCSDGSPQTTSEFLTILIAARFDFHRARAIVEDVWGLVSIHIENPRFDDHSMLLTYDI
ncbi:hypothetical protein F5Y18DRAFT_139547, partial [Xylariaceae sp. FL1019]